MQTQSISVRLLPALIDAESMTGSTAIVIDVLRATTTICTALHNGADQVIACQEIDEANRLKASGQADICGGERGGVKIEGFDFGNSPTDYSSEAVTGKTIAVTNTNGTRAMKSCEAADSVLIASFCNLSAVTARILNEPKLEIVCAGTDGEITAEDTLLAGALVYFLTSENESATLNDQALIARHFWTVDETGVAETGLVERIENSQGGRNLIRLGYQSDIALAAATGIFDHVPELDAAAMLIR